MRILGAFMMAIALGQLLNSLRYDLPNYAIAICSFLDAGVFFAGAFLCFAFTDKTN